MTDRLKAVPKLKKHQRQQSESYKDRIFRTIGAPDYRVWLNYGVHLCI